jgi:molybdopterin-guanine dinucleotide biosynthesis protein A
MAKKQVKPLISIYSTKQLKADLKRMATQDGRSLSGFIIYHLEKLIKGNNNDSADRPQ